MTRFSLFSTYTCIRIVPGGLTGTGSATMSLSATTALTRTRPPSPIPSVSLGDVDTLTSPVVWPSMFGATRKAKICRLPLKRIG